MLQTVQYSSITQGVTCHAMNAAVKKPTSPPHPNNLRALMNRDDVSQADIARAWGVENGDASQRVTGKVRITADRARVLTKHFGWTASEIYGDSIEQPARVPVLGCVGAGEAVFPIDDLPLVNGFHEVGELNCEFVDAPPGGLYRDMIALRVKGDSMEPYLSEGDIVYYNQVVRSDFNQYLGKRVVAKLKDGRVFLKTLERGQGYGKYNLRSYNAKLIESVELEWCARVAFIKPT